MPPPVVLVRSVDLPRSGRRAVVISLNRPKRHNCFNMQVIRELSAAFRSVAEEVRRSAEAHGDGGGGTTWPPSCSPGRGGPSAPGPI